MTLSIDLATYHSPNFDERPAMERIRALVIHTTEGPWPSDVEWLCSPSSRVSCHFVIAPDGAVFRLVDTEMRAWHAGITQFGGLTNWNDFSIGIELSHRQGRSIGPVQKSALSKLSAQLIQKYAISPGFVVTHRQIASPRGRKRDPSDFIDQDFALWVKSLYSGAGTYRVTFGTAVSEAPRGNAPIALDRTAMLLSGEVVAIDGVSNDGWAHMTNGLGFIPVNTLERI